MKKTFVVSVFILSCCVALIACTTDATSSANTATENKQALSNNNLVERGEYLVKIMDCSECHSPKIMGKLGPEPDPNLLLSGHPSGMPFPKVDTTDLQSFVLFNHFSTAAAGPWGVSFAANLTSDESGIGNWTEEQFVVALRKGKSKGIESGRNILPPMPWANYAAHLKEEDMKAIFAYLKSTKPVHNVVPAPVAFTNIK